MLETSARLLRLLTTLQSRRHWGGPELAEHLEVTPRTLRRDVDRLRGLGYSVEAASGPGGGYQLGKGTVLPPLLLSDAEAAAVAVSLRAAVDSMLQSNETVLAVLVKLEQLLPARVRRRVSALQAVTVSVGSAPRLDADVLTALATACRESELVRFHYRSHQGALSTRRVEPLRLAHTGNRRWYLVGWDLDRDDWRLFRVDRIEGKPTVGAPFAPREPPPDLEKYIADAITTAPYRYQARVRLRGSASEMRQRMPAWCGVLEPESETSCVLVTGADSREALVCQIVLTGADQFELIEPADLGPELQRIARRLEDAARGVSGPV